MLFGPGEQGMTDTHLHGCVQEVVGLGVWRPRRIWALESLKHRDCSELCGKGIGNRTGIQS